MSNTKRICVIGAGAAGLCAAKHASAKHLVPMVFEQSEVLGGTVSWIIHFVTLIFGQYVKKYLF